jgi:hypothetical protein
VPGPQRNTPPWWRVRTFHAVRRNELYVFTHHSAEWRAELKERFDAILTAMDQAAARQGI